MKRRLIPTLLFLLLLTAINFSNAQNIVMTNGTANGCSGTFFDPGGTGDYGLNENVTFTLCPDVAGTQLVLDFGANPFNVEDGFDFLTIYNGTTTADPTLGTYSGATIPGTVQASNPSGCLTFVFTSDGTVSQSGWAATISCTQPCQQVVPNVTSVPAILGGTYIDICQGDQVNFTGNGIYPNNNASYFQSDATSTFTWSLGDGTTITGQSVSHTYNSPGYYQVDLSITDVNGCESTVDIDIIVRVSDAPLFSGTVVTDPVICLGQTNTLTGVVTPTQIALNCAPPVAGTTFLPDGSGTAYQTSSTVDCFAPGQTVTNASDIQDICIEMEHSFLGDLDLIIECPNGTQVTLLSYPNGAAGTYLGSPIDDLTSGPGTGSTYCFDMSAAVTITNGPTVLAGTPLGNSVQAGSYLPENSFAGLIGCPLNGDWNIIITDNLASDDGYIFGWSMNFNPTIVPATLSHTPSITNESWQADPTITSTAGNTITVQPTVAGPACYTYSATDEFGCNFDTTICFTVLPANSPGCPQCIINTFNANISACLPDNTFTVNGNFTFTDNPGTGTIIVEVTNSSGTYSQVINPPFVDGQTYNFNVTGCQSDGSALTVTVYFSDNPACTSTVNSVSPASCGCGAQVGTFTTTTTGQQVGDSISLCYGQSFNITANGDFVAPGEATNPPGPTYDPGIGWMIYSCPPTVGVVPDPLNPIPNDPCFVNWVNGPDLSDVNDQYWLNAYPGVFQNNTVYWVPLTFYSIQDGIYSYVNTSMPCYEMGPYYAVTYLDDVTQTSVEDCVAGTVTTTVTGGQPALDGSSFTVQNLMPTSATIVVGSATSGGQIVIGSLVDGDIYSYDIIDANGCQITVSGTFVGLEDPGFNYPQSAYCADAGYATPTITGDVGGTFTATPGGLFLNPFTGQINIAASTPGQTYTVTYTTPGPICGASSTFDITINPLPIVDGNDEVVCAGDPVTLNGTGADTYTWSGGVLDGVSFIPGSTGTYTVSGTDINGCQNTGQVNVTLNPNPTPVINGDPTYCSGNFSTLSTNQAYVTYAWSTGVNTPTANVTAADNPITVTVTNGFGCSGTSAIYTVTENSMITYDSQVEICQGDFAMIHGNMESVAGVYSQTYVMGTGCDSTSNVTLIVNPLPNVDAGLDQTVCEGVQTTLVGSGASTITWDNGITNGTPFTQGVGTTIYTLTGTDINGCVNTDQVGITVNPLPVIDGGQDQTICEGTQVTLSGSGVGVGGSYSWNNGVIDGVAFTPTSGILGASIYTVTGTDANGCVNTDAVNVMVNGLPPINAGPDQTVCEGIQTVLNANGTGTGGTYVWDNGVTNGVAFNAPVGTITTYTVTGTDVNGCVNTDQVDITVNALPIIDAGPDQTLCEGIQTVLSGSGAGTGGTYVWNNGVLDGVPFTQSVGTLSYTVVGTDANGCINTDQIMITINGLPIVEAGPDQIVCDGVMTTLNGSGTASFSWDNGITDGVAFQQSVGTMTYTLTGTDVNGCVNTDQLDVTVHPLPNVFAGNDFVVCDGDQAILTGSGALLYAWDNGVTDGVGFTPTVTGMYTVTGTDANGCVNSDDVLVTVEELPVISFVGDNLSGCEPLTVTFTNTTPGNLANCVWTMSDGTILTGCGTVTTTFTAPGTYDVMLTTTSINGCTNSDTYVEYIYVEGYPTAAFIPSSTSLSTLDTEVSFDNTSIGASTYDWNFGDGSGTNHDTSPTHVFPNEESGSYSVELIAYSPTLLCPDTAYATIDIDEELLFWVPNTFTPDEDDYNEIFQPVFTSGFDPYDYTLLIFNRWGEIVFENHNAAVGWDGTYGREMVQDGTFTWKIEFKTVANDERKLVTGHVNILR